MLIVGVLTHTLAKAITCSCVANNHALQQLLLRLMEGTAVADGPVRLRPALLFPSTLFYHAREASCAAHPPDRVGARRETEVFS
jgi:hypothetical protein